MPNQIYEGAIFLNPNDSRNYQAIYGSQSYGTYYSVLAFFDVSESEEQPGKLQLNRIKFDLINYKGPVNLAIKDVEIKLQQKFKDSNGSDIQEKGIFIKLQVKVDNNVPEIENSRGLLEVQISDLPEYSNPNDRIIDENGTLLVSRELLSLGGNTFEDIAEDSKEAILNGVFDSEFFYRNGKDNFKKRKDFDLKHDEDSTILSSSSGVYEIQLNGGNTPTCRENKSKMFYAG